MTKTRSIRSTLTMMVVVVAALAMSATAAFAQEYPPSEDFGVTCTDAVAGEAMACTVVGAVPGETLTLTAEYNPVFHTDVEIADANGTADFAAFTVPEEAEGRVVTVTVVGSISGVATDEDVADAPDDDPVTDPDEDQVVAKPGDRLPLTGSQVLLLTSVGIALLGGGLLALRRREDSKVSATA